MKTTTKKNSGIKVTASVKAGGFNSNHISAGLKVRAGIKAGAPTELRHNHNARLLTTRQ